MSLKRISLAVALTVAIAVPAWAKPNTVTLSVPTMNCPVCPITVKQALTKVHGVSDIKVNVDRREAVVTFDDAKTSVEALTQATKEAGYPSTVTGISK
jgi:periplasmic mercuric ion binding protein